MAFETGTATSQEDLIGKIFTFLTANGWTQDLLDNGNNVASIHRDSVYVHFRWDGPDANNIALYQSLGFTMGNNPWNHPNDSGNGTVGASLAFERRVDGIGTGPFTRYWFFEDDVTAPYFYCVLEYSPGLFRHFGFGNIDKIGTWTGGEWCGGHVWAAGSSAVSGSSSVLLDGVVVSQTQARLEATIHLGSAQFPNQKPSVWGTVQGGNGSQLRADRAGNERSKVNGPVRQNVLLSAHGPISSNLLNGFINLIPMPLFYQDDGPTDDIMIPIGFMIDCRHVNINNFQPGDTISVGGDTWYLFPIVRKRFLSDGQPETRNGGIAYRQVI